MSKSAFRKTSVPLLIILVMVSAAVSARTDRGSVKEKIITWTKSSVQQWEATSDSPVGIDLPFTSHQDKVFGKEKLKSSIYVFRSYGRQRITDPVSKRKAGVRLRAEAKNICAELSPFNEAMIDRFISSGILQSVGQFAERATYENPELHATDLFQAGRNLVVTSAFHTITGHSTELNSPLYYYCVLYPLTDNVIDDPQISRERKKEFIKWLTYRLGKVTEPVFPEVDKAIRGIEQHYPRYDFPKVYETLSQVNATQIASMLQDEPEAMKPVLPGDKDPVMTVTFAKGGTALLGDAFVSYGNVSDQQLQVMFNFGVLCQLLDDFQDAQQDANGNHGTIFSRDVHNPLNMERLTNKLIRYSNAVCAEQLTLNPNAIELTEFMRLGCYYYICTGIALNEKSFSSDYIRSIETQLPISIKILREIMKSFDGKSSDEILHGIKMLAY